MALIDVNTTQDTSSKVDLFGAEIDRFALGAIGLGIALGAAALVITLAVWVQTCADVAIGDLQKYDPSYGKFWPLLSWRVKSRVRSSINADLRARADLTLDEVVQQWGEARQIEKRTQFAAAELEAVAGALKVPVLRQPDSEQELLDSVEAVVVAFGASPPELAESIEELMGAPPQPIDWRNRCS